MLRKVLGAVMVFLPCGVSGAAGVLTHTAEPLWCPRTLCEQAPAGEGGAPGNPESAHLAWATSGEGMICWKGAEYTTKYLPLSAANVPDT